MYYQARDSVENIDCQCPNCVYRCIKCAVHTHKERLRIRVSTKFPTCWPISEEKSIIIQHSYQWKTSVQAFSSIDLDSFSFIIDLLASGTL